MPDLSSPLIKCPVVVEDEGKIVAAGFLRLEAEAYLLMQPGIDPRVGWDAMRMMQGAVIKRAIALGIDTFVAYVPDCIGKMFHKRMTKLGWLRAREGWTPWTRDVR